MIGNRMDLFQTYTVSESAKPVQASGGMQIVPNYTLANAPQPKIIVIPAQGDPTKPMLDWIRNSFETRRPDHVRLHRRLRPRANRPARRKIRDD